MLIRPQTVSRYPRLVDDVSSNMTLCEGQNDLQLNDDQYLDLITHRHSLPLPDTIIKSAETDECVAPWLLGGKYKYGHFFVQFWHSKAFHTNCIQIFQVCIESQWRRHIVFLVTFCRSDHCDYLNDLGDDFDGELGDDTGEGGGGGEDEQRGGDRGGRPQTPHGGGEHLHHLHHQHDHDHHDDRSQFYCSISLSTI